jgi:hypothetical protein
MGHTLVKCCQNDINHETEIDIQHQE